VGVAGSVIKNPYFIPTDGTASHSTRLSKDANQVAGYAALRKRGKQVSRERLPAKNFLLTYKTYTARRNFPRALYMGEI
jgi:hypothetical protein